MSRVFFFYKLIKKQKKREYFCWRGSNGFSFSRKLFFRMLGKMFAQLFFHTFPPFFFEYPFIFALVILTTKFLFG